MNKKINSIISLVLATVLSLLMAAPASATNNFVESNVDSPHINTEKMLPYIYEVAKDAENWGYGVENFDSLYIGLPIHTYEYLKTGTLRENAFVYYPVFSDDELLFLILENEDGSIQLTQGFCDLLPFFSDEYIAIIYDLNKTYIACADAEKTRIAYEFNIPTEKRGNFYNISQALPNAQVKWTFFSRYERIPSLEYVAQPAYDPDHPPINLSVPKVLQYYDYICWAASTASIGNYLTGKNYTAVNVAQQKYGYTEKEFNQGASLSESTEMLLKLYNISYPNVETNNPPDNGRIYTNLESGYPMYGRWQCSSGSTHQTVIRGISLTSKRLYIMDPLQGYISVQYSNGGYNYVGESGYSFTCIGYASKL